MPLLLPLMVILALAIRREMGAPVLFRQQRPGRGGRPFTLYKFRTMNDHRDDQGKLLPDEQRVTRVGRLLRRSSLDELPELFNVLRGDMSLVGPRPLLQRYMPYYSPRERRRFELRPGITGWAQVHGRNHLPWTERFEKDVWYVDHLSLRLDVTILLLTVKRVLKQENVLVAPQRIMLDLDEERRLAAPEG
jgi:lipopolysaccharide/colanic/teichoic acid biosynthesis glycosyltransferase